MGEELKEWANMWGAKVSQEITKLTLVYSILTKILKQVKLKNDMPDDMLKDAIETSRKAIESCSDFETQGVYCI